jgi:hypothetical protein
MNKEQAKQTLIEMIKSKFPQEKLDVYLKNIDCWDKYTVNNCTFSKDSLLDWARILTSKTLN